MGGGPSTEFSKASSADDVLAGKDLTGKVACVTGANTGLGKETCRALLSANATVIMACRNMDKGNKARQDIIDELKQSSGDAESRLHLLNLDLGDLENVNGFGERFGELDLPCHYLIQNAGVMALPEYQTTKQGIEMQWGVNHVAHFLQAKRMLPFLQRDPPSRLVCVASSAQAMAPSFDDFFARHAVEEKEDLGQKADEYGPWGTYGLSKASNVLFAREFNRRYQSEGIGAASLDPGNIITDLQRHTGGIAGLMLTIGSYTPFFKTIPQGAATSCRCATIGDDEFAAGSFHSDCNPSDGKLATQLQFQGDIAPEQRREYKLWEYTEKVLEQAGFGN